MAWHIQKNAIGIGEVITKPFIRDPAPVAASPDVVPAADRPGMAPHSFKEIGDAFMLKSPMNSVVLRAVG